MVSKAGTNVIAIFEELRSTKALEVQVEFHGFLQDQINLGITYPQ